MLQLQEQYITNAQGDRIAVILNITEYQKLLKKWMNSYAGKAINKQLKKQT